MVFTWIYDLDYTLYQYQSNSRIFDYDNLKFDSNLKHKIKRLPGKKILFTNANLMHTLACVKKMSLKNTFHKVSCRELTGFKPEIQSYQILNQMCHIHPSDRCFFFEDTLDNLIESKNFGWITIYIGDDRRSLNFVRNNPELIDYAFPNISVALDYFYQQIAN
jgi:HAD superfamily hydrolase (TIGR01509 family)